MNHLEIARSFPAIKPTGKLRLTLLFVTVLVTLGDFLQVPHLSGADRPYSLGSLLLLTLLLYTLYAKRTLTPYIFCAGLLVSTIHIPDDSFFYLGIFFGVPLTVFLASSRQLILLGISVLLFFFSGFVNQDFLSWLIVSLAFCVLLFFVPLALRISWEQKKILAQEYADYKEQVAESNRALARELHDTVARHISVIGLTTGQGLDATDPSGKDAALHTIEEHSHKALTDMRLLIRTTRGDTDPTALPQTSAPTINLTQTLTQARKDLTDHGFTLNENITITEADLPDGVRPTFHKLIQEICHNAKKYAQPGCTITVTAKPNLTGVTVTTSNPAAPSNPKKRTRGTGYGLVGIGERIRALGGTMHYGVTDTTWNLTVHLPLATA